MIPDEDITVVVPAFDPCAGEAKLHDTVHETVGSVRRALPGAAVVVARDDLPSVAGLGCEPGNVCDEPLSLWRGGWCTRIACIICNGIAQARTRYALVLMPGVQLVERGDLFDLASGDLAAPLLVRLPPQSCRLFSLPVAAQFATVEHLQKLWDFPALSAALQQRLVPGLVCRLEDFPLEQLLGMSYAINCKQVYPLIKHSEDLNYADYSWWKKTLSREIRLVPLDDATIVVSSQSFASASLTSCEQWLTGRSRIQYIRLWFKSIFGIH